MESRDPADQRLSAGLIDDPQWVSYCVEQSCRFSSEAAGYVCRDHYSRHVCSTVGCNLLRDIVDWTKRASAPSPECPVEELLVFRKPQVEFRSMSSTDHGAESGYGGLEYNGPNAVTSRDEDINHAILTATIPVIVALFSTILTPKFYKEYRLVHHNRGPSLTSTGVSQSLWMSKTLALTREIAFTSPFSLKCSRKSLEVIREATLRNSVALATLFDCKDGNISRFMRKLTAKYNEKHALRTGFDAMVVMVSLCLFPYLKHRILGDMFDNRTMVIMFFDKAIAKHSQWSSLSTHVHLHANDASFFKRVMADYDKKNTLPSVVTATLDTYIHNAVLSKENTEENLNLQREDCTTANTEKTKALAADRQAAAMVSSRRRKRKHVCHGEYYYQDTTLDKASKKTPLMSLTSDG